MTKIISIATLKGGISKTLSTYMIACNLADLKYKVLCMDFDPQSNLSSHFGIDISDINLKGVHNIFDDKITYKAEDIISKVPIEGLENLDIIPGNLLLHEIEFKLPFASNREHLFKNYLLDNADIFTKVNVPKYMFLLSKNISSLINFGITLCIYFLFVLINGIPITWRFILLLYPIVCLVMFNVGVGLILSAAYVFFRDIQYLYGIFTMLLMYMSAIFYSIDTFPQIGRNLFLVNPVYVYFRYFRKIVIENTIPSVWFHLIAIGYALIALLVGFFIYKKKNHSFLYYV